jgi:hypothetical protein
MAACDMNRRLVLLLVVLVVHRPGRTRVAGLCRSGLRQSRSYPARIVASVRVSRGDHVECASCAGCCSRATVWQRYFPTCGLSHCSWLSRWRSRCGSTVKLLIEIHDQPRCHRPPMGAGSSNLAGVKRAIIMLNTASRAFLVLSSGLLLAVAQSVQIISNPRPICRRIGRIRPSTPPARPSRRALILILVGGDHLAIRCSIPLSSGLAGNVSFQQSVFRITEARSQEEVQRAAGLPSLAGTGAIRGRSLAWPVSLLVEALSRAEPGRQRRQVPYPGSRHSHAFVRLGLF